MRHWILIFLIALTPLRGWTAGDMATQMAAQQLAHDPTHSMVQPLTQQASELTFFAIISIAYNVYLAGTSGDFHTQSGDTTLADDGCSGHVSHAAPDDGVSDHAVVHCASACGACQVCHSVAFTPEPLWVPQPLPGLSTVISTALSFTSADRALGLKPPIS